ncbi:MAG: hypothetical protein WD965_06145 [Actinomycetota bacterium]
MSERRRRLVGRRSRYVLLGVGVLLSGLLAMSFMLSGTGIEDAEATAETRAEQFAEAFLFTELTPELLARDIMGTPYRDLLISVQAGILSDHRVVRLRIWKAGGDLIFSTAQRDNVDEFFARENAELARASQGEIVSTATGQRVPAVDGLEGSDEKLYQTYVPLELEGAVAPYAVVQIDQRYASIEDAANRIWRLVQMFLILALVGYAGVAVISLRQSPGAEPATADQPQQQRRSREERKRRDEEARALSAEHAERQAGMGQRIAQAGPRIRDMAPEKAREMGPEKVPQGVRKRLEETELQLRAEQAEREQFAGEVQRLRAALAEKEAELALEREGSASNSGDAKRIAELEAALKDAERRATEVPAAAKREKAAKADPELRKAQLVIEDLKLRLAEAERSTEGLGAARAAKDESKKELAQAKATVEAAKEEAEEAKGIAGRANAAAEEAKAVAAEARAEARRAKEEAAALAAEAEEGKAELARAVFEAERLQNELERRGVDVERLRDELKGAVAQVSRATSEREAAATQAAGEAREADAVKASAKRGAPDLASLLKRVEEMESQRRSDVSELSVAQQSLANTQFELMEATRKLKSAEERLAGEGDDEPAEKRPARRPRTERGLLRHPEPYPEAEPARDLEPAEEEMAVFHPAEPDIETPSDLPPQESEEELAGLSLRERLARAAAARHRTGPSS